MSISKKILTASLSAALLTSALGRQQPQGDNTAGTNIMAIVGDDSSGMAQLYRTLKVFRDEFDKGKEFEENDPRMASIADEAIGQLVRYYTNVQYRDPQQGDARTVQAVSGNNAKIAYYAVIDPVEKVIAFFKVGPERSDFRRLGIHKTGATLSPKEAEKVFEKAEDVFLADLKKACSDAEKAQSDSFLRLLEDVAAAVFHSDAVGEKVLEQKNVSDLCDTAIKTIASSQEVDYVCCKARSKKTGASMVLVVDAENKTLTLFTGVKWDEDKSIDMSGAVPAGVYALGGKKLSKEEIDYGYKKARDAVEEENQKDKDATPPVRPSPTPDKKEENVPAPSRPRRNPDALPIGQVSTKHKSPPIGSPDWFKKKDAMASADAMNNTPKSRA